MCTDQNDDWLNIYANYDIEKDCLCDELELNLCKGDGTEESWNYTLNAAEQEVLTRKMEEFCQQQTGMSLHEYAQQLRDEQSAAPGADHVMGLRTWSFHKSGHGFFVGFRE
ncbi:MAG: hypothetical protein ACLUYZ_10220 [Lachnospiraceae bacterium]